MSTSDYILQVRNLTKSFSGVKALDEVMLDVRRGEVHALMGENGAGKSTLMKILIGLLPPDTGDIWFEGEKLNLTRRHLMKQGISMIHQEMQVVPELTVAQNIFLGQETSGSLLSWINETDVSEKANRLLSHLDVAIRPDARLKELSVGEMQMVEIAKALSNKASVIIMDEPTSALSDKEVETLFSIIRDLKTQGVAILYISHKMDEIFAIADTITVLRDGRYIGTQPAPELNENALITMMVGREISSLFPSSATIPGKEILSVCQLSRQGAFGDISFSVHEGEVLGFAGLMGAGRTEIARVLFGLEQPDTGEIRFRDEVVSISSPQDAIRLGIGYVSEDRKQFGFIPQMSVQENITLSGLSDYSNGLWINAQRESEAAGKMITDLGIKTAGPHQSVMYLSGGNQQKVVIGKVLLAKPSLIILDEPTRGIDIGAKAEIYQLIHTLKQAGTAIILISSELPELLGLSDRILVLAKGQQTAILSAQDATQEIIMRYAMPA